MISIIGFLFICFAFAKNIEEIKNQVLKGKGEIADLRNQVMNSLVLDKKEIESMGFDVIKKNESVVDMKCLGKSENKAVHYARKAVHLAEDLAEEKANKLFKGNEELKVELFIESIRRKVYFTTMTLFMNKLNGKKFNKKEAEYLIKQVAKRVVSKAKVHDAVDEYVALDKAEDQETKKKLLALYAKEDLKEEIKYNRINALIYSYELEKAKRDIPVQKKALREASVKEEVEIHGKKLIENVRTVEKNKELLKKTQNDISKKEEEIKKVVQIEKKADEKLKVIEKKKVEQEKIDKVLESLDKPNCSTQNSTILNNVTKPDVNVTTGNQTVVNSTNVIVNTTNQTQPNASLAQKPYVIPIPQPVNYNLTAEQKARAIRPAESYKKLPKKVITKKTNTVINTKPITKMEDKKVNKKVNKKTNGLKKLIKDVSKATRALAKKAENKVNNVVKRIAGKQTDKQVLQKQLKHLEKSNRIVDRVEKKQVKRSENVIKKAEKKSIKLIEHARDLAALKAEKRAEKKGLSLQMKNKVVAKAQIKAVTKTQKKVEKKIERITEKQAVRTKRIVDRTAKKELKKIESITKK